MDVGEDGKDELIDIHNENAMLMAVVKNFYNEKYEDLSASRISIGRYNLKYIVINTSGYLMR